MSCSYLFPTATPAFFGILLITPGLQHRKIEPSRSINVNAILSSRIMKSKQQFQVTLHPSSVGSIEIAALKAALTQTLNSARCSLRKSINIIIMAISTVLVDKDNCFHKVFYLHDNIYGILGKRSKRELNVKYSLDEFQVRGLFVADIHESMLITAHTSAGKPIIADYIVAMCLNIDKKCFYTTPIKALSNQKLEKF
uniref:Superkiller viralicidic activity 2-like 2 (inferred by orthology to a human protein) n=1 Tax=Strongyloides venezuelensis TaxID=75913 RepID=A0A0K0G3A4_STRVS